MADLGAIFTELCGVIKARYPGTLAPGDAGKTQIFPSLSAARINFNEWAMRGASVAAPTWWVIDLSDQRAETEYGVANYRLQRVPLTITAIDLDSAKSQWEMQALVEAIGFDLAAPGASFTSFQVIESPDVMSGLTLEWNDEAAAANRHELIAAAIAFQPGLLAGQIQ